MKQRLLQTVGVMWLMVMVSSCVPKAGMDIHQSVSDARQMASDGKVDQAITFLESFLNSRYYSGDRTLLLASLLQIELGAGRLEAARKRFMTVALTSPEEAASLTGIIERDLIAKSKYQDLMDWCVSLESCKLGDAAVTATAENHILALSSLGRTDEVASVIGTCLPLLSESAAIRLVGEYFDKALRSHQWDQAENYLKVMDKSLGDSTGKQVAKISFSVSLILGRDGWRAADSFFRRVMPSLPDAAAAYNLRMVGEAEVRANELTAADSLCEFGLVDDLTRPQLREVAAMGWINVQGKQKDPVELFRRLEVLRTKKIPVDVIVGQISRNYPGLMGAGNQKLLDALNRFCESLRGEAQDQLSLRQLDGILLDISYFREDYDGSLKILERGLIIDDPVKKEMMLNKVHAHMAIKKGDYRGAIAYLRKFMEAIKHDNSCAIDPIDQVRVTTDMILGLNARRIGDLWGKAGNAEEAAKAYMEARQHYGNALKQYPDSASGENKKIMREMNAIPQG